MRRMHKNEHWLWNTIKKSKQIICIVSFPRPEDRLTLIPHLFFPLIQNWPHRANRRRLHVWCNNVAENVGSALNSVSYHDHFHMKLWYFDIWCVVLLFSDMSIVTPLKWVLLRLHSCSVLHYIIADSFLTTLSAWLVVLMKKVWHMYIYIHICTTCEYRWTLLLLLWIGKGAVYGYDAVGSYKRDDYGCMGSGQNYIMPILDNLVSAFVKVLIIILIIILFLIIIIIIIVKIYIHNCIYLFLFAHKFFYA